MTDPNRLILLLIAISCLAVMPWICRKEAHYRQIYEDYYWQAKKQNEAENDDAER